MEGSRILILQCRLITSQDLAPAAGSVTGRFYTVTRADDLASGFGATIASNLPATPPLNTLTDTNTAAGAAHFYRIAVTQP